MLNGTNSAKIQQSYNFTRTYNSGLDGMGQTIAIVDAYGSPTIQSDLQIYNQKVEQGAFGADEQVSLSFSSPEVYVSASERHALDQMFAQAIAEGINVFVSSGDCCDFSTEIGRTDVSFPLQIRT